jgi:hypothetical protein
MKYQEWMPHTMNCSIYVEQSMENLNQSLVQWKIDRDPESGYKTKPEDYLFNMTSWLSYSVAPGIRYCFNIGLDAYSYYLVKDEVFGGFVDWFPAWLQNLLGNTVTFSSLYEYIKDAHDTKNMPDAMFWYGRLVYIIFDFHPIDNKEDDLDFNEDSGDPWWVDTQLWTQDFDLPQRRSSMNTELRTMNHHPRVDGWFDEAYGFIAGFLNITFGTHAPNVDICISNITRVVEVSLEFGQNIVIVTNDSWLEASLNF